MSVGSIDSNYALPQATRQPTKTLDKDAFLRLFIEQLKSQDPMSPQDSNAFIAQMAQFSMVEQLTNMNTEIKELKRSQELGEAAALIGRQVKVLSDNTEVSGQVEKVAYINDEVQVFVSGVGYGLTKVTEVK